MATHAPAEADALGALLDEPLGVRHKAIPPRLAAVRLRELGAQGLNVARGDLPLPAMTLREDALDHNLRAMADWCREHDVRLAPHGKTTMAPQLLHRQLDAGAWAITAASVSQAAIMREHGVRRVLIANEVADRAALEWLAWVRDADPAFEVLCLVDSVAGVAMLDQALAAASPLPVLLELGLRGRRAGARDDEAAVEVGRAVAESTSLRLAGVECFEGVAGPGIAPEAVAEVDAVIDRVHAVAAELDAAGCFAAAPEILLSAGGSVFFDRVVRLRAAALGRPVAVVLRSGCYVTHDSGAYDELSPFGSARAREGGVKLRPALELWSAVLSRPEPELAILGFGKRDAPYDAGLPVPLRAGPPGGEPRDLDGAAEVLSLNDQHAIVRVAAELPLDVGDHVVCGVSHPCTAFDKWTLLPVVDAGGGVVAGVRTLF